MAVISLAKRIEEIFIPGRRAPLVLDHSTPELQLLQRVRDEAHRFAITHHRSRRDRAMTSSLLDELPGVGPARKRALLAHFGSPEAVLAASSEELQAVPGLPAKVGAGAARATCTAPAERAADRWQARCSRHARPRERGTISDDGRDQAPASAARAGGRSGKPVDRVAPARTWW